MPAVTARKYSGYLLGNRDDVLERLTALGHPPRHERVHLEHITFAYPAARRAPRVRSARIVAHAEADGVQALLVEVDGTTVRPNGRPYHLTYSLAPGREPVESNSMLAAAESHGTLEPVDPIALTLTAF